MSVTAPAPPSSRRPRRKPPNGDNEVFGTFLPANNPTAVRAYRAGVFAMVPFLGLMLGPLAVMLGIIAGRKCRDPEIGGRSLARAAVIFGWANFFTQLGGTACIAVSRGWLG